MEILDDGKSELEFDWVRQLKALEDTKLVVQRQVGAGVVTIPKMFWLLNELAVELDHPRTHIGLPVIDLSGILTDQFQKIVDQVQSA